MSRLEELKEKREKVCTEIYEIENKEKEQRLSKLIGKCYRYRNNASCPETEADYWWLYTKITGYDGGLKSISFQATSHGTVEFREDKCPYLNECHEEITEQELWDAFRGCLGKVESLGNDIK